jgi:hypothetical protein
MKSHNTDKTVTAAARLEGFFAMIRGLHSADAELLKLQLEVEAAGGDFRGTNAAGPDPRSSAVELLNGYAPPLEKLASGRALPTWSEIIFERRRIEHALVLAAKREPALRAEALSEYLLQIGSEYETCLVEIARHRLAERALVARVAAMSDRVNILSGGPGEGLKCDPTLTRIFAPAGQIDAAYDWFGRLAAAGFLKASEVANA